MKKKLIFPGITAVLITATLIGGSVAYFQASGHQVQQQINTKTLGIELKENGKDGGGQEITTDLPNGTIYAKKVLPGAKISKELYVRNTRDTALYTRVTLTKYWGIVDQSGGFQKDMNKNAEKIKLEAVQNSNKSGDGAYWILQKEDSEQMVFYYTKPLEPGDDTKIFMNLIRISSDLDNDYADLGVELKVQADAVQVLAGKDAMMSEWGILATFDENGYITKIEE